MDVALPHRDTMLIGHGRRLPPGWPTDLDMVRAGTPIFSPRSTPGHGSEPGLDLDQFDGESGRLTAADAQTGDAAPRAATFQGMDQRGQDSGAGGPDRMAQRTGPAVDIDPGVIQIQVPDG